MNTHSPSLRFTMTSDYPVIPNQPDLHSDDNLSDQPAIDLDTLDRLRLDLETLAPGLLDELIELYLANSPGLLTQMRQGITEGDTERLRIAAHTLKSNSARLGAIVSSQLCRELERMGQEAQLVGALEKIIELEHEHQRAEIALTQWQQE